MTQKEAADIYYPKRIQRKRTKGWKMPPDTISVTRPGKWGNPFVVGGHYISGIGKKGVIHSNEMAVSLYRVWVVDQLRIMECIEELRGKNLACFCKEGEPCHADVLLELANK